jgi:hypothetical protein
MNTVEAACAQDAFAVTASDVTQLAFDALYIGGAGDVAVETVRGTVVTFPGVLGGSILPIKGYRVMSTNTTATSIVGMKY